MAILMLPTIPDFSIADSISTNRLTQHYLVGNVFISNTDVNHIKACLRKAFFPNKRNRKREHDASCSLSKVVMVGPVLEHRTVADGVAGNDLAHAVTEIEHCLIVIGLAVVVSIFLQVIDEFI